MLQTHSTPLASTSQAPLSLRFHVPFEHGAWWSYLSTLVGGVAVAWWRGVDPVALGGLGLALLAGFVAQDWVQALLGALLRRRGQALSHWMAPQGWFLGGLSLGGALIVLQRVPGDQRWDWALCLGGLGLAGAGVLALRVLQPARGRQSLAAAALLLAAPALPLGLLAFGPGLQALGFWAWPLAYYPAATLAAQSYIRGFPPSARWSGPALAGALGLAALALGASLAGALLLLQAGLLGRAIGRRWRQYPQGLPPGGAIRIFGRQQASFGVALTLLWAWAYHGL